MVFRFNFMCVFSLCKLLKSEFEAKHSVDFTLKEAI